MGTVSSSLPKHFKLICAWEQDRSWGLITQLTSASFSACPQCWRAGWTTPGSWSLLNPWPVCPSSNTAWNGCWHSWARCSRSPYTAPHEGTREQQQPQSRTQCAGKVQQRTLTGPWLQWKGYKCKTWHAHSDLQSAAVSPLGKVLCDGIRCSSQPVSYMNIYMNINGKWAS